MDNDVKFAYFMFKAVVVIIASLCLYHFGVAKGKLSAMQTKEQSTVYIPVSLETDAECMLKVMEVEEAK